MELPRSRWRVVITRLPPGPLDAIQAAFPRPREVSEAVLPLVVRTTTDLSAAQLTANRLREAGAIVVLMEEPSKQDAFCSTHTSRLAEKVCQVCQHSICLQCIQDAEEEPLCAEHMQLRQSQKRILRLRQLFLLFLLAAFGYEALSFVQDDRQRVDPTGPVTVALLQFVEPGYAGAKIIRQLNDPDSPVHFQRIADLFNAEHTRYTNTSMNYLRLEVLPPQERQIRPPQLTGGDASWWELTWASWSYLRYFDQLARDTGVSQDTVGVQLFLIFGPQDSDLAAHSRGSERGRTAVSYVAVEEHNPAYALVTLAHELGHTLGALDRYDIDTSLCSHPEGFVEPFSRPLYPQEFAELMAVDVPLGPGIEGEIRDPGQIRIGHRSAAEMRWISTDQADQFYTPNTARPEDRLREAMPPPLPEDVPSDEEKPPQTDG
ncbi:MAG: hypothetical protein P8R54_16875 [Myxococcota bacterium]|nr:hypothetical protein [Myxococcota bacterium]